MIFKSFIRVSGSILACESTYGLVILILQLYVEFFKVVQSILILGWLRVTNETQIVAKQFQHVYLPLWIKFYLNLGSPFRKHHGNFLRLDLHLSSAALLRSTYYRFAGRERCRTQLNNLIEAETILPLRLNLVKAPQSILVQHSKRHRRHFLHLLNKWICSGSFLFDRSSEAHHVLVVVLLARASFSLSVSSLGSMHWCTSIFKWYLV